MNKLTMLIVFAASLMGCSNQWRDVDSQVTSADVQSMLSEVQTSASLGGGGVSDALAMKDDPSTAIYFAEAELGNGISPMGTVQSVISLKSFAFIGLNDLTRDQIQGTRIFFLDQRQADGSHRSGLIIGIKRMGEGTFNYYGLSGTGSVADQELTVSLQGSGGQIAVRSMDLDGSDLLGVIQLRVWDTSGGGEVYIGKFSTLVGFGG